VVSHAAWQLQFRPRDKRTTIFFKWASRSTGRQTLGRPPRFLLCNELCRLLYTDSIKSPLTLAHQGAGLTGLTGVGLTGLTGAGLTGLTGAGLTGLPGVRHSVGRAGAHAQGRFDERMHALQSNASPSLLHRTSSAFRRTGSLATRPTERRTPVRPGHRRGDPQDQNANQASRLQTAGDAPWPKTPSLRRGGLPLGKGLVWQQKHFTFQQGLVLLPLSA
jgi:hypothetical protein